jgi:uncharacterized membrane protein YoaK (UPF0700 family)
VSSPPARQAAASLRHPLTLTLLALTFSTGTVDAVSYLALGHVFTANMTGNIVLLGFGIARAGGLPVLAPVISTAAFALGSGFGGSWHAASVTGTPSTSGARSASRPWPSASPRSSPSSLTRTRGAYPATP